MKTFVVSAVSIVLVSILFCPIVMSSPSVPDDLQMVQPDPSLPKELSTFFDKWEFTAASADFFIIVEKIDNEKASLYTYRSRGTGTGWLRHDGIAIKEGKKYKVSFRGSVGPVDLTLKGEYLNMSTPQGTMRLRRVQ